MYNRILKEWVIVITEVLSVKQPPQDIMGEYDSHRQLRDRSSQLITLLLTIKR